ncbi:coiled coil domain containing protein Alhambra isoform X3 [Megachile rotundata]|uniref:coiled coil domain containing protein Alhambra isoform X3 n=1 Tax=Megachile rotundata TaxID=143995 RepID=UPI00061503D8|nr:PREDICTED: protein AF-10 isoform X3 [Megachile rotundata]
MKEMLGGCCVCSDERGWTENPLVYCDGQGCTVAVHQACYGIVTVPTGPWYCRKCESQERSARVRCELCPSRDGALKRTDQAGWAHVVCALYIPEVRFGNVTTMEPIILQLIPSERFSKSCYICEEQGRGSRANVGACMQCNKTGCRQQFHVTCAQALGLLCEEAGNYLDNVKYCGYCQHHYSKLKKGGNVKTIPPYKPIPADNGSSDSSPEKEAETPIKSSSSGKRKSSSSKSTTNSKNKSNTSPSLEINGVADDKSSSGRNTPKDSTTNSSKFTTSNFVETIVTQSESVFGHDGTTSTTAVAATTIKSGSNSNSGHKNSGQTKSNSSSSNKTSSHSKKRKTGARTPTVIGNENSNQSVSSEASGSVVVAVSSIVQQAVSSNNIQTTITEATSLSTTTEPEKSKKLKVESPIQSSNTPVTTEATTTPVIMTVTQSQSSTVAQSPTTTSNSIVVSVPLTATSLSNTVQSVVTSAPTLYQQLQQSIITTAASMEARANAAASNSERFLPDDAPAKRSRSQSSDKQEKSRKPKRGSSNSQPALPQTQLQTQPQQQQQQQSQPSASSVVTSVSSSAVVTTSKRSGRSNHQTPPPAITVAPVPSIIQGPTLGTGHFSSINSGSANAMGPTVKESPPSSPGSESMSSNGPGRRKRKSASAASTTPTPSASSTPTLTNPKEEKDIKLFQNGVSAPHMLGNQLNPTSTMAQKMSDTLSQELEAHSIFTEASNSTTNLVGPQLHSRVIASIRSNQTGAPPTSFSSVFNTNSNTNSNLNANSNTSTNITATGSLGGGTIPQTLDQLLERQWEQGSQFLMEQAQHFDSEFASLLSCLHQLRAENLRLEEHVNSLLQRRDHLLAVNARLAIPLTTQPSAHPVNNIHPTVNPSHPNVPHPEVPPGAAAPVPRVNREPRVNNTYMPHSSASNHSTTLENGLPPDPSPPAAASLSQYQHRTSLVAPQPSPTIRHSPAGSAYHQGQPSNIVSPAPAGNSGVVRNSSVTPDPVRGIPSHGPPGKPS